MSPRIARGGPVLWLVVAAALVVSSCASGHTKSSVSGDAQRYYRLGEVQFGQGKTQPAIDSLKKAIALDPKNSEAENLLGLIYLSLSEYKEAQEHLKEAVRINPYFTDAHNILGVVYKEQKQYDRALREFQIALNDRAYATPEKIHLNLGHLFMAEGNHPEAIRAFQQAVAIKPDYLMGLLGLGMAYQQAGESDQARREFQKVVKLGPDSAEATRAKQLLGGQVKREGP